MISKKLTEQLARLGERAGYIPAGGAGICTGYALAEILDEAGMGNSGLVLAAVAGAAVVISYVAFIKIVCRGVAPLPPEQRRKALPAVIAGGVCIALGSAYPNIIVTGGGVASGIADRSYVATLTTIGDQLKMSATAAVQVESAYDNGITQLEAFVKGNIEGLTSSPGSGPVVATANARIASLKQAKADLAPSKERIRDEMARFDLATDGMRASLLVDGKTPAERRLQMQRFGDDARSAAIGIGGSVPIIAFESLADSLMGPQVEPIWSANPDIRRTQIEGFAKYREELKRIGKSIKQRLGDFQKAVTRTVPVYDPAPHSVLVLRYAYALTNIYAVFLLLDGFPLILFAVLCAMYDAVRRHDGDRDTSPSASSGQLGSTSADDSPLGPHPHPRATAARILKPDKIKEDA